MPARSMAHVDVYKSKSVQDFFHAWQGSGQRRQLSVRELAKRLKYSSDRTLGMVIKGQRAMSSEMIDRIADQLSLSPNEKVYLQLLAQKDRLAKSSQPTASIDEKLTQLRPKAANYVKLSEEELRNVEHWGFFVVLELIRLSEGGVEASQIIELIPDLERKDLDQILTTLSRLKFISERQGKFKATSQDVYLKTEFDVPSASIRRIHANQLARSILALETQSVLDREFITKTFRLNVEKLPELKRRMREIMQSLGSEFTDESISSEIEVYQLGFQLFRQSKRK